METITCLLIGNPEETFWCKDILVGHNVNVVECTTMSHLHELVLKKFSITIFIGDTLLDTIYRTSSVKHGEIIDLLEKYLIGIEHKNFLELYAEKPHPQKVLDLINNYKTTSKQTKKAMKKVLFLTKTAHSDYVDKLKNFLAKNQVAVLECSDQTALGSVLKENPEIAIILDDDSRDSYDRMNPSETSSFSNLCTINEIPHVRFNQFQPILDENFLESIKNHVVFMRSIYGNLGI